MFNDMMKKYSAYIIVALTYYLMPALLVRDTGSGMSVLLFLMPLIVSVVSALFSKHNGFKWYFSIMIGLLWLPNILILNDSALIYSVIYAVISFIGQFVGVLLRRLQGI